MNPLLSHPPLIHPPLRLYRDGRLEVSGGHSLHVWEGGNAEGLPAVVLHGGPGSGSSPFLARLFDPTRYRIIGFDQRGSGKSLPAGAIEHNTLHSSAVAKKRIKAREHAREGADPKPADDAT